MANRTPARSRAPLLALTLAFALAGAAFAVATPLFQGPDEPAHVDLVRHYGVILDWGSGEVLSRTTSQYRELLKRRSASAWT